MRNQAYTSVHICTYTQEQDWVTVYVASWNIRGLGVGRQYCGQRRTTMWRITHWAQLQWKSENRPGTSQKCPSPVLLFIWRFPTCRLLPFLTYLDLLQVLSENLDYSTLTPWFLFPLCPHSTETEPRISHARQENYQWAIPSALEFYFQVPYCPKELNHSRREDYVLK